MNASARLYRRLMAALNFNQVEMAELIGVSRRTSQGYAAGEYVPAPTAILLGLLDEGKITVEDIGRHGKRRAK